MWIPLLGVAVMGLLALVLNPLSSLLALMKFCAFAVAGVCGFAWYFGGPAELYALPCVLATAAWVGLQFVPTRRRV